jgi:mitochondrial fission protein ELM1
LSVLNKPIVIWRFTDGKAGHDTQSLGLTNALSALTPCKIEHVPVPSLSRLTTELLTQNFRYMHLLPDPQLLVGAGHKTHLPLLCARKFRGGKAIVLMKPSLPVRWFDLCLIPEHDNPPHRKNIQRTCGALNRVSGGHIKQSNKAMVLIGGPSRHFNWDTRLLADQIHHIISAHPDYQWILADSPRTPAQTKNLICGMTSSHVTYHRFADATNSWLADELATSKLVWVTEDSISMIYEALTAGAAVGLIELPKKSAGRLTTAVRHLADSRMVTSYQNWKSGQPLAEPKTRLNEAERCARVVLEHFALAYSSDR